MDQVERFETKVARGDGCWLWQGARLPKGYGKFSVARGRWELAHRVAWRLANGSIPHGMQVLHRCDNPRCVRVEHLFLGTAAANTADMMAKGRGRFHFKDSPAVGEMNVNHGSTMEHRIRRPDGTFA